MFKKLLLLFLLISLSAFGSIKDKKDEITVFTKKLDMSEISTVVEYLGKLVPRRSATIYSPVEGVVQNIRTFTGAKVKKGSPLAKIQQNLIGLEVRPVTILAPMSGLLIWNSISDNQMVNKNDELFSVYDSSEYYFEIHGASVDAGRVTVGDTPNVKIGDKEYNGTVLSVARNVDYQTGTRVVKISVKNDKELNLMPGSLAKATFKLAKHRGFLVDKKMIYKKRDKSFLKIVTDKNLIKDIAVTIAANYKDRVEITSSELTIGSMFITKSSSKGLIEGQEVKVVSSK